MGRKKWKEVSYDKARAAELAAECGTDVFATLLMLSRGIDTPEKIRDFLDAPALALSSPFLMADMDIAVARITAAIENEEHILIYGDYDADGVTATAVLYGYLSDIGANVSYFIPSRFGDGYGISMKTASEIAKTDCDLIITVDNGISAIEEARFFKEHGIDLIVTDHHTVGDTLPDCVAVIDPHRPDDTSPEKNFAGCGVAMKLVSALEGGDFDSIADEYLGIVALGTVADIVPLTGENRTITVRGLRLLSETDRPGLKRLMKEAGIDGRELSARDISFGLSPRINSAGRIFDASLALDLLMCEDEETAEILTAKITEANTKRQELESEMLRRIEEAFDADPSRRDDKVIVACGKEFHPGVIGIVAAKLVEKYCRPVFVISTDGSGISTGSARSPEGFALYDALNAVSDCLVRFGGHRQAAGFALKDENIGLFRSRINRYATGFDDIFPTLTVDCRLNAEKLSAAILDSVSMLSPFGAGNPEPVFGLYNMRVAAVRPLKDNKHIRVTLTNAGATVNAIYFGVGTDAFPYVPGDLADVAFRADKNEYRGETALSLIIADIRSSGINEEGLFDSLSAYYNFRQGINDEKTRTALCPDRLFITTVYKYLRSVGSFAFSPEILCVKTGVGAENAGRAKVCLDALTELKLIFCDGSKYTVNPKPEKTDLTDSTVLQKLGYRQ